MSQPHVRNLARLQASASTSRVLNLMMVWRNFRELPGWSERPLFANPHLNRSLIIKHRLRRDELDLFRRRRQVATKVVIPIDPSDLKLGGRYVFVDQSDFSRVIRDVFGTSMPESDLETLRLIDQLPSLDPFLLREQLARGGRTPDPAYFDLTEADRRRMFAFAQAEIAPLVAASMGRDEQTAQRAAVLVGKILSNADGDEMEPLRLTLRLAPEDYAEGVFCWKGFLYYKWSLASVMAEIGPVAAEIARARPFGPTTLEERAELTQIRENLVGWIKLTLGDAAETLKVYDTAYGHLTGNGRPTAFREFLLDAPLLFVRLGEQVAALRHIVSFWRYRVSGGPITVDEMLDIFSDFEVSLARNDGPAREEAA
ncbi:MAG TPA: hypothetical protein PLE81_04840 [Brevundimonas sp.]|uniref:hypothetical protein n=1 Tax=Brevundimonas sp. TaxID=1871086 RepID=UPI002BCA7819|nr:hypothetical protein [Brevundimonas sp.]HRH19949.1 hypothetical protein [Brevundimonas sp.]